MNSFQLPLLLEDKCVIFLILVWDAKERDHRDRMTTPVLIGFPGNSDEYAPLSMRVAQIPTWGDGHSSYDTSFSYDS